MNTEEKTCGTCLYYDVYQEKCRSEDSPHRGEYMDDMHTCQAWTDFEEDDKRYSGLLEE